MSFKQQEAEAVRVTSTKRSLMTKLFLAISLALCAGVIGCDEEPRTRNLVKREAYQDHDTLFAFDWDRNEWEMFVLRDDKQGIIDSLKGAKK